MTSIDLLKDNERKVFNHYLIPSICSTLVSAIYILIDTLIIGHGVSAAAISALNIFLPFYSLYMGIGMMLGVGGGILISAEEGTGNKEKSDKYLTMSILAAASITIILTLFSIFNLKDIMYMMGANDSNIDLVMEYAKCIVYSTPIFICSYFLAPIVRNKKEPRLCMIAVLVGAILNIVLDYIFVYPMQMGMRGAALASALSSLSTSLVLLSYFVKKKNRIKITIKGMSLDMLKKIVSCGSSSFLMEIAGGFVILIFNNQILKHIGESGVVVYGIITNCILVGVALFNGVAQAGQPVIATNFGAKESVRVSNVLKYATKSAIIIGIVLFFIITAFPKQVISVFVKVDNSILSIGIPAIRMYLSAFCLMGVNILMCNYFQAVGKESLSITISIVRGFLLNVVLVIIMPILLGGNSLWLVVPITEIITFIGICIYCKRNKAVNSVL